MLASCVIQDTSDVGSGGIKIVFLAVYNVGVNLFGNLAQVVKSAATPIERQPVGVKGLYSGNVSAFLVDGIAPWIVFFFILR